MRHYSQRTNTPKNQLHTQIPKTKLIIVDSICRRREISRWRFFQEAIDEKIALEKEIKDFDRTNFNPTTRTF